MSVASASISRHSDPTDASPSEVIHLDTRRSIPVALRDRNLRGPRNYHGCRTPTRVRTLFEFVLSIPFLGIHLRFAARASTLSFALFLYHSHSAHLTAASHLHSHAFLLTALAHTFSHVRG